MNTSLFRRLAAAVLAVVAVSATDTPAAAEHSGFGLAEARRVVQAAVAEARKNNAGGAIAVVDDGGHLLVLERLDGTFPAASAVAIEKARTAAVFRRPTRVFEEAIRNGRTSLVAVREMTPLQGGVPIVLHGVVVGAVGVSGAASAQQDDDIAAVAAVALGPATAAAGK